MATTRQARLTTDRQPQHARRRLSPGWSMVARAVSRAAAMLLLIVTPIALSEAGLPFVGNSYGKAGEPLEIFAFLACAAMAIVAYRAVRQTDSDWRTLAPRLLGYGVAAFFALLLADFSTRSIDYGAYESAARSLGHGNSLYAVREHSYIYSPIPAQALHSAYVLLAAALPTTADERLWDHVFYLYQTAQWLLIVAGWHLSCRFGHRLGLSALVAAIAVSAIFVVNAPLLRTLRFNQVNLWVLDSILLALLTLETRPAIAGLVIQAGALIKVYPLALLPAALLGGRMRAVAGFVLGGIALLALSTGGGRDWRPWSDFLAFTGGFPLFNHARNNSLYSLFANTADLAGIDRSPFVWVAVLVSTLSILGWFAWRAIRRERAYRRADLGGDPEMSRRARVYGHALDGLSLALLLAPSVWTHHFVLAIPVALWAIATAWRARPGIVAAGLLLVFALPTLEVFPLGHHHALGLALLVIATGPVSPSTGPVDPRRTD